MHFNRFNLRRDARRCYQYFPVDPRIPVSIDSRIGRGLRRLLRRFHVDRYLSFDPDTYNIGRGHSCRWNRRKCSVSGNIDAIRSKYVQRALKPTIYLHPGIFIIFVQGRCLCAFNAAPMHNNSYNTAICYSTLFGDREDGGASGGYVQSWVDHEVELWRVPKPAEG